MLCQAHPPQPDEESSGCSFYNRCDLAIEKCFSSKPKLISVPNGKMKVRCFRYDKLSTKSLNTNINVEPLLNINDKSNVLRLNDISITYTKQSILDQILIT